jgi:hypothetical protein
MSRDFDPIIKSARDLFRAQEELAEFSVDVLSRIRTQLKGAILDVSGDDLAAPVTYTGQRRLLEQVDKYLAGAFKELGEARPMLQRLYEGAYQNTINELTTLAERWSLGSPDGRFKHLFRPHWSESPASRLRLKRSSGASWRSEISPGNLTATSLGAWSELVSKKACSRPSRRELASSLSQKQRIFTRSPVMSPSRKAMNGFRQRNRFSSAGRRSWISEHPVDAEICMARSGNRGKSSSPGRTPWTAKAGQDTSQRLIPAVARQSFPIGKPGRKLSGTWTKR